MNTNKKLLNLLNWSANTHQTKTEKLFSDSMSFKQDWDALTPTSIHEKLLVDGKSQLSNDCDNAPRSRTQKVCNKEKKDKTNITLKQASPKSKKGHNLRNIRKSF